MASQMISGDLKTAMGNKKRRMPTSEFMGKFDSKKDLLYYLKHNRTSHLISNYFFSPAVFAAQRDNDAGFY